MRIFLRKLAKKYLSDDLSGGLKRFEYKSKKRLVNWFPPISQTRFEGIVRDELDVHAGDDLFVHSSSTMMNIDFGPAEMIEILQSVAGPDSTIFVPTFPRTSSVEQLERSEPFDARSERSGMGALSEYVRQRPDAFRSLHPTKSVAGFGPRAEEVCRGHEDSKYSFDAGSPYSRIVESDVRVLGLGAQLSYLTMVHVWEDCHRERFPIEVYHAEPFEKQMILADGSQQEKTYFAHDLAVVSKANPERFIRRNLAAGDYRIYNHLLTPFFSVRSKAIYDKIGELAGAESVYY